MALSPSIAGRVYGTALSLLASGGGKWDAASLAYEIAKRYRAQGFQGNLAEFRAVINRAMAGVNAAMGMNIFPDTVPGEANYPNLSTIDPSEPKYLTRVLVTVNGPGGRETTVIEVRTDSPISASEAVRQAIEIAQNMTPRQGTNPRFRSAAIGGEYTGVVQSTGQRG